MEESLDDNQGKMGFGCLRYSPHQIVAVVDSVNAGKNAADVTGIDRPVPVVADVRKAKELGAEVLILGIAPPGGLIPKEWLDHLDEAVAVGLSLVNGLHDCLEPRYRDLPSGQFVWDIRQEPPGLGNGYAEARKLDNRRVLLVGTDMSVGKMTAGLEMWRHARERGISAEFVATGQIGITITGRGVPLDAVRVDFAAGAIEREVMAVKDAELIIVEGQGSLIHPASTSPLPLFRGSCATHLIICHRAGMERLPRLDWVQVPPMADFIRLNEDVAQAGLTVDRPLTAGVALNTRHLDAGAADKACEAMESELGIPVVDPIRHGPDRLVESVLA